MSVLLAGPRKCNWPSVTFQSVSQNPVTYGSLPAEPDIPQNELFQLCLERLESIQTEDCQTD